MTWGRGWRGVPGRIRCTIGVGVAVLGYGGLVHVGQLVAGGWPPYPWAPAWLAAYFTALTVCDPLAAVLLWLRRAAGLHLAILVLVTDALANAYALYGLSGHGSSDGIAVARLSQAVVSVMAVCALAAAPRLRPWLRPTGSTGRSAVR